MDILKFDKNNNDEQKLDDKFNLILNLFLMLFKVVKWC